MPRKAKPARLWLRPAEHNREAVWCILDKGRKLSTGCLEHDIAGAERALARHTGAKYEPQPGRALAIPIAEVLSVYLRERVPQAKRPDHLTYTAESAAKWWGDKFLSDVRGRTCLEYVQWRTGQAVSVTTAWHDLKTLRSAINYWHKEYGPLPALPVVTMPSLPKGRVRWLTRSEAARLLWAARKHPHVKRLILIGLYSGTRSGAILALKWVPSIVGGWIDVENGVLHRMGDKEEETAKRRPSIPIHDRLLTFLPYWRAEDVDVGIGTVCHYQGGQVKKLRRSWTAIRKAAGLGKDVTPHVLRHTATTWLLQAGVPIWEVAGFVGMSEETVRRVYGHHSPDHMQKARAATNKRR